jgi:hypothetical protein
LKILDGEGNFPQAAFRNISGRRAEGVCRLWGIEVRNVPEVRDAKVFLRVQPAAGEQHIRHAALQGGAVFLLDVQFIQSLQKTAIPDLRQFMEVVGQVVVHGVFRR